jgi:carboxypeptidase Q
MAHSDQHALWAQHSGEEGAAAIVIRSVGTDHNHRNPHTGNTNFEAGVTPIPAGALSIPDADNLVRMVERGKPVKLRLLLTPKNLGTQKSGNVVAELPGSNAALPPIVIACHLDSWDLGTGAIDDAAGCGIITAAASAIKA